MQIFILLLGFTGAWLLFAGPIYQAALELKAEDLELDRIKTAGARTPRPPAVSVWWWLIPPVKVLLERRRSLNYRRAYIKSLSSDDAKSLVSFMHKATAWLFVATGGLCIAFKETYELAEHLHWSHATYWMVVIALMLASVLHIIARLKRTKEYI